VTSPRNPLDSGTWPVSVAFWLCLFAAGSAYAGVALAPKLVAYLELRHQYVAGQTALVELERRNLHLERVTAALESDPQFAAELSRVNLDAARPGEERIAVDPSFHLEARPTDAPAESVEPAWYLPHVRRLAGDAKLRQRALIAAGVVVVLAFALLHDANGPLARRLSGGLVDGTKWAIGRYRPK
jgi:cell division protein FtsB